MKEMLLPLPLPKQNPLTRTALLCAFGLLGLASLPAMSQEDPLARAAAEAGAVVTESGMVYKALARKARADARRHRHGERALPRQLSGRS
jgi:hypothetical protein